MKRVLVTGSSGFVGRHVVPLLAPAGWDVVAVRRTDADLRQPAQAEALVDHVRPSHVLHLAWNGPPLRRVIWSERCYLVPWEDGTLLVGATVEEAGFDERTTAAGVHDLIDAACDIVPRAWTSGLLSAKAGLRPASPDELPIIGSSSVVPNLIYATGHYRNGVLLAPLTSKLVADAMLENKVDRLMGFTSPQRFGKL